MSRHPGRLDPLVADIVARCGLRFTIATDDEARDVAYRLRYRTVVDQGWVDASTFAADRECDEFDAHAVHLIGWDDATAVATGRIVLPGEPLPTEVACGMRVAPLGRVVDVGRMAVARSHQSRQHSVFLALLARLYIEVQRRDYEFACGMVSDRARTLMRLLGLELEELGEARPYWGELRAPVRFRVVGDAALPGQREVDRS